MRSHRKCIFSPMLLNHMFDINYLINSQGAISEDGRRGGMNVDGYLQVAVLAWRRLLDSCTHDPIV